MKWITTFTLYFCFTLCYGQSTVADSLKKCLKFSSLDTSYIRVLHEIGNEYKFSNFDSSFFYYNTAKNLAYSMQNTSLHAKSTGYIGVLYYSHADYNKAQIYYNKTIQLYHSIDETLGEAKYLKNSGVIHLMKNDYSKAISLFKKAIKMNRRINNEKEIAANYGNIGIVYARQNKFKEAEEFFNKAFRVNLEANNLEEAASNLSNIGNIHNGQGEYEEALVHHNQALEILQSIGNKLKEASVLGNIGIVYRNKGEYAASIKYHHHSLKINLSIDNKKQAATNYGNIGLVYWNLKQYEKALNYLNDALALNKKLGIKMGIAANIGNIGLIYSEQKKYRKAIKYYTDAIVLNREINNQYLIATNLSNIGLAYLGLLNYRQASNYYEQALVINKKIGDKNGTTINLVNLAEVHNFNQEYSKSIKVSQEAIRINEDVQSILIMEQAYLHLTNSYKGLGDFKKALNFKELWVCMKDSLFNQSKYQIITEIETKYDLEKNKKEIVELNLEKEIIENEKLKQHQKSKQILFFILGMSIVLLSFFFLYRSRKKALTIQLESDFQKLLLEQSNKLNEGKKIERDRIAAELHDGIGSELNGVFMQLDLLTRDEDSRQYKYVSELQNIGNRIRDLSHQMGSERVIQSHLPQLISDLCTLHISANFQVRFFTDNELEDFMFSQKATIQIYYIVQEALNNILKHADATNSEIRFLKQDNKFTLEIKDNGKGIDRQINEGFGMNNIRKRVSSLKGECTFITDNGTTLTIAFPLKHLVK